MLFIDSNPSKNTRDRELQDARVRAHLARTVHQRRHPRASHATDDDESASSSSRPSPLPQPVQSSPTKAAAKCVRPTTLYGRNRRWTVTSRPRSPGLYRASPKQPSPPASQVNRTGESCSCAEGVACLSHLLTQALSGSASNASIFDQQIPSQGARTDPFGMLPAGEEISPQMDCWLQVMAPFNDIVHNIFGVTNIYTRSFLELMHDEVFFNVGFPLLLIMIATLRDPYGYPSQDLLLYRGKGMKSLRSQIARAAKSKAGPTDSMIAMVAGLCTLERYLGNFDIFKVHAKSLQFMVAARGGLDALGTEGDLKARLLNWDTFWSLSSPTTLFPDARPAYQPVFLTRSAVRSNPSFMKVSPGFRHLAEQGKLSIETLNLLVRVQKMLDATRRRQFTPANKHTRDRETTFPDFQRHTDFQSAYPCLGAPDSPQPNFEKLVCLTVFLFCVNAFFPVRSNSNLYGASRQKVCAELPRIDVSQLKEPEIRCLSWISMVVSDSWRRIDVSGVVLLPQGIATLTCARRMLPRWELPWEDARADIMPFFWTPAMLETWRTIFEQR